MADAEYIPADFEEAKRLGSKHYFTGIACKRGHVANRYVCDKSCVQCKTEDSDRRKLNALTDPELAEKMKGWHRKAKAKARKTPEGKRAHYEANKRYAEGNRPKVRAYYRERRATNPEFRMASWCRSVLSKLLARSNRRKDAKCVDLIGYTGADLKAHIERQFTKGMDWSKFGTEIHIDHIIPVAEFIKSGETRPSVIHALSNLRPMWAEENRIKRDKVLTLL